MSGEGGVAAYDAIAGEYAALVSAAAADPGHVLTLAAESLLALAGEVAGLAILDLGCGEGHLARRLSAAGGSVTGVDLSERLLALAEERSAGYRIRFLRDDAQSLATQPDEAFDLVVSNFALMDIPDLTAVFRSVARVLRPGARFVFSITHPCFQLPRRPGPEPASSPVADYAHEGFWTSEWQGGVRGRVGAHHRTLSTYVNELSDAGFRIERLAEPTAPSAGGGPAAPKVMVVLAAERTSECQVSGFK